MLITKQGGLNLLASIKMSSAYALKLLVHLYAFSCHLNYCLNYLVILFSINSIIPSKENVVAVTATSQIPAYLFPPDFLLVL